MENKLEKFQKQMEQQNKHLAAANTSF